MKRRSFIESLTVGGGLIASGPFLTIPAQAHAAGRKSIQSAHEHAADVVVAGGGLGGVAAALGALRNGLKVILTEETDWIGGQMSAAGVTAMPSGPRRAKWFSMTLRKKAPWPFGKSPTGIGVMLRRRHRFVVDDFANVARIRGTGNRLNSARLKSA